MIRNYQSIALPTLKTGEISKLAYENSDIFVLSVSDFSGEAFFVKGDVPSAPRVAFWDLRDENETTVGYAFKPSSSEVIHGTTYLLIQSPSLTRQYTLDDAMAHGNITKVATFGEYFAYTYDIGATLVTKKASAFMAKILHKDAK